jgi:hypothetical protein
MSKRKSPPEKPMPDWATETVPEQTYSLTMFGSNDDSCEQVDVTRAEYIALKVELARMRGYATTSPAAETDAADADPADAIDPKDAVIRDRIATRLMEFCSPQLLSVEAAIECVERRDQMLAPTETFITECLENHSMDRASPDLLEVYWNTFRREFAEALSEHVRFAERYATELAAEAPSASCA